MGDRPHVLLGGVGVASEPRRLGWAQGTAVSGRPGLRQATRALVLRAQNLVGRSMCREQLAHLVPPRRTQLSVPSSDMGIRYLMII